MTRTNVCFPCRAVAVAAMAWSDSVCADCLDHIASEELSEEDQQLKNELDMLVERLTVRRI
jgi:hypothetical protein